MRSGSVRRKKQMRSPECGRAAHTTAGGDAGATRTRPPKVMASDTKNALARSAGVPPAVAGASRPRFGEVKIRDRGHVPHWEKRAVQYVTDNPVRAGLQNWPWVWVCGRDAHTTAGGDVGATKKPSQA